MNMYGSRKLHWFLIDRWYFKNIIFNYTQDELLTLWHNVNLVRVDDMVRRDIGRLIVKASSQFN